MRLSAKSEYAVKALLDLALHAAGDLQPIQDIAARQGIPQRYLEQVLLGLKQCLEYSEIEKRILELEAALAAQAEQPQPFRRAA